MQIDEHYSRAAVCPVTREVMYSDDVNNHYGMCPKCGDNNALSQSFCHVEIVRGRWLRPSICEWIVGKRKQFIEEN